MPQKTKALKTKTSAKKTKKMKPEVKKERYFEAVGRRKTAIARVRIFKKNKGDNRENLIIVNQRKLSHYFPLQKHQNIITAPFDKLSLSGFRTTVKVKGSGPAAQAESIRLGIARALVLVDNSLRPRLKAFGFLRRDPRMVERKKPGLRKARRPQQWRKR